MTHTKNTKPETHYIVQTAAACMPASCWGHYGKVAVLEVDAGVERVAMISERARGCHRVVEVWDRQHMGEPNGRSAFYLALAAARELAAKLNDDAN